MKMINIRRTFIEKYNWQDGPWKNEPDFLLWTDPETGYLCEINRMVAYYESAAQRGYLCGYVYMPKNHPYNKLDLKNCWFLDDGILEVHGGVTFQGSKQEDGPEMIGFDCGHCFDISYLTKADIEVIYKHDDNATYKDIPFVMAECEKLAKQLKDLEQDIHCSKYIEYLKKQKGE